MSFGSCNCLVNFHSYGRPCKRLFVHMGYVTGRASLCLNAFLCKLSVTQLSCTKKRPAPATSACCELNPVESSFSPVCHHEARNRAKHGLSPCRPRACGKRTLPSRRFFGGFLFVRAGSRTCIFPGSGMRVSFFDRRTPLAAQFL